MPMGVRSRDWVLRLALVLLVGCSNPYKEPLPADVKGMEEKSFQASIAKLPEEERKLLAAYVIRVTVAEGFGAKVERAKTVGEAITAQRTWILEQEKREAEAKALAAKVEAERAAAEKKMNEALVVAVTSKKFVASDIYAQRYEDRIHLRIAFDNKSGKELKGVKGAVEFRDLFGDEVSTIRIAVDDPIAAGQTYVWEGSKRSNKFNHEDTKLANTPLEKLKVRWIGHTYLFADGSDLRAPAAKRD